MSEFSAINLAELSAPDIVETLKFEQIFEAMRADLVGKAPRLSELLDSDPAIKILQVAAYRELLLRARINDASRAVMLAFATGNDLNQLAALFGVKRLLIEPGDPNALPPTPDVWESDERLRRRTQLSLEGHSTAGSIGSYVVKTLEASPLVKDVSVESPAPGEVLVTLLSVDGDGSPDDGLLQTVLSQLNAKEVRPLTDEVTVAAPDIRPYRVFAELTLYDGPDLTLVKDSAQTATEQFIQDHHKLGHDIVLSGLYAALHQPGVQKVHLIEPTETLVINSHQAAFCTEINIQVVGRDV